jgi:hypothetical protein
MNKKALPAAMNRRFPISDRSNGRNEIGELINFGQTADGRASSMAGDYAEAISMRVLDGY